MLVYFTPKVSRRVKLYITKRTTDCKHVSRCLLSTLRYKVAKICQNSSFAKYRLQHVSPCLLSTHCYKIVEGSSNPHRPHLSRIKRMSPRHFLSNTKVVLNTMSTEAKTPNEKKRNSSSHVPKAFSKINMLPIVRLLVNTNVY